MSIDLEKAEIHLSKIPTLFDEIQELAESPVASDLDLQNRATRLRALFGEAVGCVDLAEAVLSERRGNTSRPGREQCAQAISADKRRTTPP